MDEHPKTNVPPTPVPGLDLRTWLAGCAMANANVVTSNDPALAAKQALSAADNMLIALKSRVPTRKSMRAPTIKEMNRMTQNMIERKNRDQKITAPALKRKQTKIFNDTIPDPNRPNGRYSMTPSIEK